MVDGELGRCPRIDDEVLNEFVDDRTLPGGERVRVEGAIVAAGGWVEVARLALCRTMHPTIGDSHPSRDSE